MRSGEKLSKQGIGIGNFEELWTVNRWWCAARDCCPQEMTWGGEERKGERGKERRSESATERGREFVSGE